MEKDFEYYLEMARGPVRTSTQTMATIEDSIVDSIEGAIDDRLMMTDNSGKQKVITIDVIAAINSFDMNHPDVFEMIDDKVKMTEVVNKLIPKYKQEGWSEVKFSYPKLTLKK
jgi:flagellar motor switch protein FliG